MTASARISRQVSARAVYRNTTSICHASKQIRRHSTTSSSVNPNEISHFDSLAASWWDPHGSSRILHLMNPIRHDFIRGCHASQPDPPPSLMSSSPTLRYLDVGCGGGIFAESAARLSTTAHVTGIDASPGVLSIAQAHARQDPSLAKKLTYRNCAIEDLPLPSEDSQLFDVLSVFEVIEHVVHPSRFLDNCAPFVKPGGWLVMSTIARTWTSWVTTKLFAEDILRIVPRGTHEWDNYINEEELRQYFAEKPEWGSPRCMGVVYVPGLGWKEVPGSEKVGNYLFAVRKQSS